METLTKITCRDIAVLIMGMKVEMETSEKKDRLLFLIPKLHRFTVVWSADDYTTCGFNLNGVLPDCLTGFAEWFNFCNLHTTPSTVSQEDHLFIDVYVSSNTSSECTRCYTVAPVSIETSCDLFVDLIAAKIIKATTLLHFQKRIQQLVLF